MKGNAVFKKLVDRFLIWKLPKDFSPDAGISFNPTKLDGYDLPGWWPVGTNLLNADQAHAMFEYLFADAASFKAESEGEGDAYMYGWFDGAGHFESLSEQLGAMRAKFAKLNVEPASGLSRHSRAMLLNVLWYHQGGSSEVGQPIRQILGIGQYDQLTPEQLAEAKWIERLLAAPARIAGLTLSQFRGPHDMALECVNIAREAARLES